MKKLALVIAIAMIAAFGAPAFAGEVNIGMQYRLIAIDSSPGFTTQGGVAYTTTENTDREYFEQRLRVPVTWKVNDNVTANLRMDIAEIKWGDDDASPIDAIRRTSVGTEETLQVDRSYVTVKSGIFSLVAGQQFSFAGLGTSFEGQFFGLKGSLNLNPVTVDLWYSKADEGASNTDETRANDDDDIYVGQVSFKSDAFTIGGILGRRVDASMASAVRDDVKDLFGVWARTKIGDVNVKASLDFFGGDVGTNTANDYSGTQGYVGADMAVTDALTVGLGGLYAEGADGNDTQITSLMGWGVVFNPMDFGGALAGGKGVWYTDGQRVFDQGQGCSSTNSAGVLGVFGSARFAATDSITLLGKLAYLEPEKNINLNNKFFAQAEVDFQWMPNVVLAAGINYINADFTTKSTENNRGDDWVDVVAMLGVNF